MPKRKNITWSKNVSPVGWYISTEVLRAQWDDEDLNDPDRLCLIWDNQILIKARNPEEAYAKAIEHGEFGAGDEFWDDEDENRRGHWVFEGLSSLLPIYDKLEDGSELTWMPVDNIKVSAAIRNVLPKEELQVFNSD